MHAELVVDKYGPPPNPSPVPSALQTVMGMADDCPDRWRHADLASAYHYLRKSKHLRIPPDWAPHLPRSL